MDTIVVNQPTVSINDEIVRVSSDIAFPDVIRELWFECDAINSDKILSESCDAFLVAILIVAMRDGMSIVVQGNLSSKLYYSITEYYMEFLRNIIKKTKKIEINVKNLTRTNWGGTGVYTGFSAGVNSFCTIFDHSRDRVPPEYEVTQLLFNNVGSHGQSKDDSLIFRDRFRRLENSARAINIPILSLNSNIDSILNINFQLTHTLRNISAALLFQKSCAKYLYSSAFHYRDFRVRETYDIGYADAVGVPLLSTETTECISAGGQHTRFEKTKIISSFEKTYASLDVCVAPQKNTKINCSKCWKCLRTQLTLDILGTLSNYHNVFDIKSYHKFKWIYMCSILRSRNSLDQEVVEALKKYQYPVPISARIVATLIPTPILRFALDVAGHPRPLHLRIKSRLNKIIKNTKRFHANYECGSNLRDARK